MSTATTAPRAHGDGPEVDAVVVGAGPVGLAAAALMTAYGLSVLVVERNDGTSDEPKAISLDDESLRTFAAAGLIDAVLPIVTPGTGTRYYAADGEPLFQARAAVPYRHGYPFKNPFAQPELERALAAAVASRPLAELRFATEFVALTQDADGVTTTLRELRSGTQGTRTVRSRYLLACDGGRSPVRESLPVGMTGRNHDDVWLVADTLNDRHDEPYGMHHGDPRRPYVVIPGSSGRCRYEMLLHEGEGEPGAAPFELVRRLLAPLRDLAPGDVQRAVCYRFNSLVADRWSVGRVHLLGDAAHMMPPFAGQGLNSGIRDAANLTWKIADVIHGRLAQTALATYETERKPHAAATVRLSGLLGRIVMTTDPDTAHDRDLFVRQAMASPQGRAYLEEMRYRPVPDITAGICAADAARPGADPALGSVLGQPRARDDASGDEALLDEYLGGGWALLGVDVRPGDWHAGVPTGVAGLQPREIDVRLTGPPYALDGGAPRPAISAADDGLPRETAALAGRFALVRPDRFIAATWAPDAAATAQASLARHLPQLVSTR